MDQKQLFLLMIMVMSMLNILKRLENLEKSITERNKPTQELLVYRYFNSIDTYLKGEGTEEDIVNAYEKVKKSVPDMHLLS